MGNNQQEICKPLSSYYPVVGDEHFSLKNYMRNRRLNAMEFQKVKAENSILTDVSNSIRTKLNDTIRENQNYCYRNMQLFDKINDNLIEFDKILVNLRNIQETQIVNSEKFKFSFMEQAYEKRFKKQKDYLKKQYIKTKNFKHDLRKAWSAFEKPDELEEENYLVNVKDELMHTEEDNIDNVDKLVDKIPKKISSESPPKRKALEDSPGKTPHQEVSRQKLYEPIVNDIFRNMKRKAVIPDFFNNDNMELVEKLEIISKF